MNIFKFQTFYNYSILAFLVHNIFGLIYSV